MGGRGTGSTLTLSSENIAQLHREGYTIGEFGGTERKSVEKVKSIFTREVGEKLCCDNAFNNDRLDAKHPTGKWWNVFCVLWP